AAQCFAAGARAGRHGAVDAAAGTRGGSRDRRQAPDLWSGPRRPGAPEREIRADRRLQAKHGPALAGGDGPRTWAGGVVDALTRQEPVDTLAAKVAAAQAELQSSIDRAGLRDDPFRHPLQALSSVVGLFPEVVEELTASVDRARDPIGPAEIDRLGAAAAAGAELARTHSRRTALAYGGVLIGAVIAAATVGAFWGKASAKVAVHETERGLTTAFQDGPAAASTWLNFMQANDGNLVREACVKSTFKTADGRRACTVGL